jgi:hypothetical protein
LEFDVRDNAECTKALEIICQVLKLTGVQETALYEFSVLYANEIEFRKKSQNANSAISLVYQNLTDEYASKWSSSRAIARATDNKLFEAMEYFITWYKDGTLPSKEPNWIMRHFSWLWS